MLYKNVCHAKEMGKSVQSHPIKFWVRFELGSKALGEFY
jgi:hypothetical protein